MYKKHCFFIFIITIFSCKHLLYFFYLLQRFSLYICSCNCPASKDGVVHVKSFNFSKYVENYSKNISVMKIDIISKNCVFMVMIVLSNLNLGIFFLFYMANFFKRYNLEKINCNAFIKLSC